MSHKEMRLLDCESSKPLANQSVNIVSDDVVKAINAAHGVATMAARNALIYGIECGRLLSEVREQIPHGEWGKWIAANVPGLSDRTERQYRRFYENRELIQSATDPIRTISDAANFLTEQKSNRHENAEIKPDEGRFLRCMDEANEIDMKMNAELSEIAVESSRSSMEVSVVPTVDAIDVHEVLPVVDKPHVLKNLKENWRRFARRYDRMALPWIDRMMVATIIERLAAEDSIRVVQIERTTDAYNEYDDWLDKMIDNGYDEWLEDYD